MMDYRSIGQFWPGGGGFLLLLSGSTGLLASTDVLWPESKPSGCPQQVILKCSALSAGRSSVRGRRQAAAAGLQQAGDGDFFGRFRRVPS